MRIRSWSESAISDRLAQTFPPKYFMAFLAEAQKLVGSPNTSPVLKATLEYMLEHCVGVDNATPIATVIEHLDKNGFSISRQEFQHQVLVPSRETSLYIASFGNFGRGGIYLVADRSDAQPMIDFYENRIESETRHLKNLKALVETLEFENEGEQGSDGKPDPV